MPAINYLSSVEVKISATDDGKFKGHIISPDGEHMVTTPYKTKDSAIGHAFTEARTVLMSDNLARTGVGVSGSRE